MIIYRSDQAARKLELVRSATVPIIRFVTQPRALEDVPTTRATRRGRRSSGKLDGRERGKSRASRFRMGDRANFYEIRKVGRVLEIIKIEVVQR